MPELQEMENRLANVERELAEIKQRLGGNSGSWIQKITGSFKDDPEFDEILKLGRELRRAEKLEGDLE
jgi:hypothetical protein